LKLVELLQGMTHNAALITFLVSMAPIVELRAAIPIGISLGLGPWQALLVSVCGNLIPVPFIILFIRRIFHWMRVHMPKLGNLVSRLEQKAESHRELVERWKFFGLLLLVAIPLPGTGAWTGALVAAIMDMRLKHAFPAIFAGVIVAGFLVLGITVGFADLFL
jgi:uncharacterized membrane protein